MKKGDSIGHEFMGIVESVGSEVETIRPGMRVVVAFPVADGTCEFCKRGAFTLCETTNDSKFMNEMYGHRTGGIYGYSHLLGGYQGGQVGLAR